MKLIHYITTWLLIVCVHEANAQSCYVTRAGNTFQIGNSSYRFIGVNLGATHLYNYPDNHTGFTTNNAIQHQIVAANNMGAKVIRVFSCEKELSHVQNGDRLQNLINIMNNVNPEMRIIVVLTNSYNNGGHFPAGDEVYHNSGSYNIYNDTWYDGAYNNYYKPWVQYITYRFRNEKKIFAWEIGNEMQASNGTRMLNFAYDIGYAIKAQGANQMISTGFTGIGHAFNLASAVTNLDIQKLYNGPWGSYTNSPFDFGSVHVYNNEQVGSTPNSCNKNNPQNHQIDIDWFVANSFPYIVGEAGFSGAGGNNGYFSGCTWNGTNIPSTQSNRKPATEATCNKFFDTYSCDGFMTWGFKAPNGPDVNGHGDNDVGMDASPHTDYNDLFNYFSSKASTLPGGGSCSSLPFCNDYNYMYNMTLPAGERHYYAAQKIKLTLVTIPSNAITHLHAPQISLENCTIGGNGRQLATYNDPCVYGQPWPQAKFPNEDGIEENINKIEISNFTLYPNPLNDKLYVKYNMMEPIKEAKILFYNQLGQLVKEQFIETINKEKIESIALHNVHSGIVLVLIVKDSKILYKEKMYKN